MRTHVATPIPGPVPGVSIAHPVDAAELIGWTVAAWAEVARNSRNGVAMRLCYGYLAIAARVFAPILRVVLAARLNRPRWVYYVTPERDAFLAVSARPGRWHIEDHVKRPGTGGGKSLRDALYPFLLEQADVLQLPVTANAASTKLARLYVAEIPGLTDRGRAFPYGRKLRRDPAQPDPLVNSEHP